MISTLQDIKDFKEGNYKPQAIQLRLVKCVVCSRLFNLGNKKEYCNCFKIYKLFIEND